MLHLDSWAGGDAQTKVLGGFSFGNDEESVQRSEREAQISHVRECQDVETNAQLCHSFVYLTIWNTILTVTLESWKKFSGKICNNTLYFGVAEQIIQVSISV